MFTNNEKCNNLFESYFNEDIYKINSKKSNTDNLHHFNKNQENLDL